MIKNIEMVRRNFIFGTNWIWDQVKVFQWVLNVCLIRAYFTYMLYEKEQYTWDKKVNTGSSSMLAS